MAMKIALLLVTGVSGVRIIGQPQDQFVPVGGTAIFNCSYVESRSVPYWLINNAEHSIPRGFPSRHSYSLYHQRLTVSNVQNSDNRSTYQCGFNSVRSRTARLFVVTTSRETTAPMITTTIVTTTATTTTTTAATTATATMATTATEATATNTNFTETTTWPTSTTAETSIVVNVTSVAEEENTSTLHGSITSKPIQGVDVAVIIGSLCVSAVIILLCVCIILLGIFIKCRHRSMKKNNITTATTDIHVSYEDVKDPYYSQISSPQTFKAKETPQAIQMTNNECYSHSTPTDVCMTSNESYAQTKTEDATSFYAEIGDMIQPKNREGSALSDINIMIARREDATSLSPVPMVGNKSHGKLQGAPDHIIHSTKPAIVMITNTSYAQRHNKEPVYAEVEEIVSQKVNVAYQVHKINTS